MTAFTEHYFTAPDGIKTYYRKYAPTGPRTGAHVLCMHGLTRNSRDFEDVSPHIAAQGHPVIAIDTRGRAKSDYDPNPANYHPGTYVQDVIGLLDQEDIKETVCIGTSMGGLMTMILAASGPSRVLGAVINDIGPELDPVGLGRIQGYVGGGSSFKSWGEAGEATRAINGVAFPKETGEAFWIAFAKRICRETETGDIVLDYDKAIAQPVKDGDVAPPDLWPFFNALAAKPLLLIRGAITDLLNMQTVDKMKAACPQMIHVDVPHIGHAPLLSEPEARSAIDTFLSQFQ